MTTSIRSGTTDLDLEIQKKIDTKIKPIGALGKLEQIAFKLCRVQNSLSPQLKNPQILVFAGDHGLATAGVSPYPQEVTYQMVLNFINGGAAINVFCEQNSIDLVVIDAGVNGNFANDLPIVHAKVAPGTANSLEKPAMTEDQLQIALDKGSELVQEAARQGCNVIGFGEMGIGNTSAASLIMHSLCNIDLELCIGRGTGSNDAQLAEKKSILAKVAAIHTLGEVGPLETLRRVGGFEIAMMTGAFMQAAASNMLVLVDGFITSAAFLVAQELEPALHEYSIFTHCSDESGHKAMLNFLKADFLLNLDMRLGEGTGCAVAYPLIKSAEVFLNNMASFDDAGVSTAESIPLPK